MWAAIGNGSSGNQATNVAEGAGPAAVDARRESKRVGFKLG
jgi:hypothetical protein